MLSFTSPAIPACSHAETSRQRLSYVTPLVLSSSLDDVKLPIRVPGFLKCYKSNVKCAKGRKAVGISAFWHRLRWKQVSVTRNVGQELGSDTLSHEKQESDRPNSIPELSDESLAFTGPNVLDPRLLELQQVVATPVERIKESWNQITETSRLDGETRRRRVLGTPMFMSLACVFGCMSGQQGALGLVSAIIDSSKAPSQPFDVTDERLRDAAFTFEQALNASTVAEEEQLWTLIIDKYGMLKAEWVSDIISRAYGNRGNARSRQGKLEQALEDYDKSIALAPYAVDPVLNRGVVLEGLGRYDEASADYEAVLKAQPNDPAAWNNLGNVKAAQNNWDGALISYGRAVQLAPVFSFAAANYALALYQVGRMNEAVKQFRSLLRKYPEFPDMRAALAVSLYAEGLTAEAESNWVRLEDGRYKDRGWVRNIRKWPPRLVNDLEAFLDVSPTELS